MQPISFNRSTGRLLPAELFQWAVVAQNTQGESYLFLASLHEKDTGERVCQRLKEQYLLAAGTACKDYRLIRLVAKNVVGTATIQWIGSEFEEEQYTRVNVEGYREDETLTKAFHHPNLLRHERTYVQDRGQLAVNLKRGHFPTTIGSSPRSLKGQQVIVIRRVFDRSKIALALVLMIVFSPAIGTIAGVYSHRAEVGVALGAGIFALASFLVDLFAWLQV